MAKATYQRKGIAEFTISTQLRVHGGRFDVQEQEQFRTHIPSHKQQGENTWDCHKSFGTSKSFPTTHLLQQSILPNPSQTLPPTADMVFKCMTAWGCSNLATTLFQSMAFTSKSIVFLQLIFMYDRSRNPFPSISHVN